MPQGRRPRRARRVGRDRQFPLGVIMNKGLTMRTAQQHGQRYVPRLLAHAERGELDASYLVTHTMSLEDAPRGYEMFKKKQDGCVRVLLARRVSGTA